MNDLKIKNSQQTFSIIDISMIWAGINICLPSFMLGGILVPSLHPITAIIITILGNTMVAVLIYLLALPGLYYGYSSAIMSRYIFGRFGSYFTSFLVLASMIGWSGILLELSAQATMEIFKYYNITLNYEVIVIIIGFIIILSSQAGAKQISKINNLNVPMLLFLLIWISYIIFKEYNIFSLLSYKIVNDLSYNRSLDLVIGGTIAGIFVSSDLNRFAVNKKSLSLGVFIGTIPATTFMATIGILASLAAGSWNPINIIINLGMGIPALLLVVLSIWTTTQASLYSGSLAITNIFPALTRKKAVIVLGIIMILTAIYQILSDFEVWLILLDNLFSPIIAIALYKTLSSRYSKLKIDWNALITIVSVLLLKNITPASISSAILTIFNTIIIYFLIEKIRPSLRRT